jgi:beta-barrel assembly-enhancing protease
MKRASALTGLLLGLGLTLTAFAASDTSILSNELPDMGSPADAALSKSDEVQLGRMVARELRDQNQMLDDPELADYIQHLGNRLAAQTGSTQASNYQYFIVRDPVINAFAAGSTVAVNSGLILLTQSESELASVMAHETAHILQRHVARGIQEQSRVSLASTAAMLAAILVGAAGGSSQAMLGGFALGQSVALQKMMNFSRSEEAEADRVGIGLLAEASFNTAAMPRFFEQMARSEGVSDYGPLNLLLSHPVTSDRIAEARARAAQNKAAQVIESSTYPWMVERLRVMATDPSVNMTAYYTRQAQNHKLTDPERYGEALAQLRQNQAALAATTLRRLVTVHPDLTALYASYGQALLAAGQQAEALQVFDRALTLFPRNVPVSMRYADALMQSGQPKKAHELLLDLFNNVQPTPEQIRQTAMAASAAGDNGDAYYYMSEYQIAGGNLPLANQQLELALASPDLTPVQRQRFRARLQEIREWMREQQRTRGNRNPEQPPTFSAQPTS